MVWVRCSEAGREDRGWGWSADEGQPWACAAEPADGPADGLASLKVWGQGLPKAPWGTGSTLSSLRTPSSRRLSWSLLLPAVVGPSQTAVECAELGAQAGTDRAHRACRARPKVEGVLVPFGTRGTGGAHQSPEAASSLLSRSLPVLRADLRACLGVWTEKAGNMGLSCPDQRKITPHSWGLPTDRRQGRKEGAQEAWEARAGTGRAEERRRGRVTHVGQGHGHCWKNRFRGLDFLSAPCCLPHSRGWELSLHMKPLGSGLPARGAGVLVPRAHLRSSGCVPWRQGLLTGAEVALDPALWGGGLCPGQGSPPLLGASSSLSKPRYTLLVGRGSG